MPTFDTVASSWQAHSLYARFSVLPSLCFRSWFFRNPSDRCQMLLRAVGDELGSDCRQQCMKIGNDRRCRVAGQTGAPSRALLLCSRRRHSGRIPLSRPESPVSFGPLASGPGRVQCIFDRNGSARSPARNLLLSPAWKPYSPPSRSARRQCRNQNGAYSVQGSRVDRRYDRGARRLQYSAGDHRHRSHP